MTVRVKEIIGRIVRELGTSEDPWTLERRIHADLARSGYGSDEVREAFGVLLRLLGREAPSLAGPMRVLGPEESVRLTPEARRWLLGRYWRAEIGREVLEEVLEAVAAKEGFVDEREVRILAAGCGGTWSDTEGSTVH